MLVGDIYLSAQKTHYLLQSDTVADYQRISEEPNILRFPVVNHHMRLMGIITAKDVVGKAPTQVIDRVMTKDPISVKENDERRFCRTSNDLGWFRSHASRSDDLTLEGLIPRQDVMKAMQLVQRQPGPC